jgi:hypothetical protein
LATVDGPKYTGSITLDLTDVKDDLVDLPPGAMKGIRTEHGGIDKVIAELAAAMPAHGDAANIPALVYQRFVKRTTLLGLLRGHEVDLEKALEVVRETRAKTENDREDDLSIMVGAAQDTARRAKDPGLVAPFEETIKYNGQVADKAAATRKKNAELKAEAAKNAAATPKPSGGQTPPQGG